MREFTTIFQTLRLFFWAALAACGAGAVAQDQNPSPEYQQILPRGRIASIDNPTFVPAAEAKIADDSWVFGVVIDGEARAYSLTLLNSHEVVNDRIGDEHFAAVW